MEKKSFFTALIAIAGAVSCAVEPIPEINEGNAQVQLLTIQATHDDSSAAGTKTVRNDDGSVSWQTGDRISLFFGNGNNGGSVFTTNDSGKTASFTGTIKAFTAGGEDFNGGMVYFWGLYPYDANATCNNSSITTTIPSIQRGVAGTFSPGQHITLARSENLLMSFKSVCSGLRFTLQTEGIDYAVFHPLNDVAVAGDITVSMAEGLPLVTSMRNTSSKITLIPEDGAFEVGKDYYFEFAPFSAARGFEVTLYKGDQQATFTYSNNLDFERNIYNRKRNLDEGLDWEPLSDYIFFEDANFKAYCISNFDINGDGEISMEEAERVTEISVRTDNIYSLGGIEYFQNLTSLNCIGSEDWDHYNSNDSCHVGQLCSLDIRNNTSLVTLICYDNKLTSLDVSRNTSLTELDCAHNNLSILDVSNNNRLDFLDCSGNLLTSLDVRTNTKLRHLRCSRNELTSLILGDNEFLGTLECEINHLTSLDVTRNLALQLLFCQDNELSTIDLSNNSALEALSISINPLINLDISNNTSLGVLYCDATLLTSLDLSNTNIGFLSCNYMPNLEKIILRSGQIIHSLFSDQDAYQLIEYI